MRKISAKRRIFFLKIQQFFYISLSALIIYEKLKLVVNIFKEIKTGGRKCRKNPSTTQIF